MKIACWKCSERMPAVALMAPNVEGMDGEVCILTDIVGLPDNVLEYLKRRVPTFRFRYSKIVGSKYYANTCPSCGMLSGDFFLHSEPGGPFFPTDEEGAARLYLTEIPIKSTVFVQAGYHMGTGDLILKHAQRIA